ncbi:MAG: hypothetical protein MK240_05420 [Opitutales bacterium]|nr:hypothetical protein [Opitutales bacterium]
MSETKENQAGKEPSDEQVENPQTVSGVEEVDPSLENLSQETPKNKTSIMYGTRKLHPGSKSGSGKSLKQLRGPQDDVLEMDDLVVKSTAPAYLIENDRPNSNRRRDRDRDTEDENQESNPTTARNSEEVAYPVDEVNDEDRPERFAEVKKPDTARNRGVQEFRPSKDGKRGRGKKRSETGNSPTKRPASKGKPKGFFGWIKSVFTSEDEEVTRYSDGKKRRSNQNRRRNSRGGQNRSRDGQRRGDGSGDRRPRGNRRPRRRSDGPSGQYSDSQTGNRPRRRRRKPQAEGRESESSS